MSGTQFTQRLTSSSQTGMQCSSPKVGPSVSASERRFQSKSKRSQARWPGRPWRSVKVVCQATRTCSELWSRPATRKARRMRYPYADHSTIRLCTGAVPGAVQKDRLTMTGKPENAPVAFSNLARNQGKPASQPHRAHSVHEHLHLRGLRRGVHVADRVRPASGHGLLAPPAVRCGAVPAARRGRAGAGPRTAAGMYR